jgi:hypothetical protein
MGAFRAMQALKPCKPSAAPNDGGFQRGGFRLRPRPLSELIIAAAEGGRTRRPALPMKRATLCAPPQPPPPPGALMKLAGGCPSLAHELSVDSFLKQVGAAPGHACLPGCVHHSPQALAGGRLQ